MIEIIIPPSTTTERPINNYIKDRSHYGRAKPYYKTLMTRSTELSRIVIMEPTVTYTEEENHNYFNDNALYNNIAGKNVHTIFMNVLCETFLLLQSDFY